MSKSRVVADIGSPVASRPAEPKAKGGQVVAQAWSRNQDLLRNASSLAATTVVTSALGFAYWVIAARLFSRSAVGYGSASVSAMTLFGTIGMLGLGTLLIGELPNRESRAGLISAALLTSGLGSLVLGLAFVMVAPQVSGRYGYLGRTADEGFLFVAGVMLTGVTLVFDQATIGLLRGGIQLSRNIVFAIVKLLILIVTAKIVHDQFGVGITLSWITGMTASLIPIGIRLIRAGGTVALRPDLAVLRRLSRAALAHNWLNLALAIPRSLIPVLVIAVVSPQANSAFYAAWTLIGFLYIVPVHLTTVLFALAAANPAEIARRLRFTLMLSFAIGLPGMCIFALSGHFILSIFGRNYAQAATVSLLLLTAGYLPTVPKLHYVAVCRAKNRVSSAAAVMTIAALAEVAASVAGGLLNGLNGLAIGLLAVFICEGLATTPLVLRVASQRCASAT